MLLLKKYWEEKPLLIVVFSALFFRLLAVLFSKGYGMHDDHFLIIEAAQSWADNHDYNNWLPSKEAANGPSGHSLFYTGMHFLFFKVLQFLGLYDPQFKMYLVRLLHAAFSMITVVLGYRIALHYKGKELARHVGLLLGLLWFMPMLSVRNLIEVVCVPFLITATWLLIKNEQNNKSSIAFLAGLLAGMAFSIRFQSSLFIAGIGLVLLIQKNWKAAISYGFGAALSIGILQGITDFILWKRPFAEFAEYVRYNIENANNYNTQAWYQYFLLIGGILIPPISLFMLFGFFRSWKKYFLLFLPSFIFLAFHSYFPNKQERFIFPIIPFLVIVGSMGWAEWVQQSKFWQGRKKLLKGIWMWFWIINIIPLLAVSVAYSKRNRVEAMTYLSKKTDVRYLVIEDSNRDDFLMPPLFYLRNFNSNAWGVYGVTNQHSVKDLYLEQQKL